MPLAVGLAIHRGSSPAYRLRILRWREGAFRWSSKGLSELRPSTCGISRRRRLFDLKGLPEQWSAS
jgi:hypothetical protein